VRQALLIPLQAVLLEGGTPQVWIYENGVVRRQPVQVGGVAGNELVVSQGLKPGDTVVTAGVHLLKDGQKVRPTGAPAAPAVAPSPAAPPAPAAGARNG
jgi:multidrug efflux pump subunit AcrA (membrane-fusion protein)